MNEPLGAPQAELIEWGKAFRFFQPDAAWPKKLLLGGLFSLLSSLIVGAFFVAGYFSRLIVQVARGDEDRLPEWEDLGGIFLDGAKALGVYLALTLPLALVPLALGCSAGLVIPLLERSGGGSGAAEGVAIVAVLGMTFFVFAFVVALYALMFYLPSALTRVALTGRFAAGLAFRDNLSYIWRNLGSYVLAVLLYIVAGFMALVGYLACCVGIFVTSFWCVCVFAWCLGSIARRDPELGALARALPRT